MGKRANDLTLTLQTSFEPELRLLVDRVHDGTPDDWVESRAMEIKTLGNTYVQGSSNNIEWSDKVTASHSYFRISTDGGTIWRELTADLIRSGINNKYYTDASVSANPDVAANTNSRHSHTNKPILDNIISSGDGTRFLANDGSYRIPVSEHGLLLNLSSDDHPQYLLASGSRDLAGIIKYSVHPTFNADTQLVDKKYVDDASSLGMFTFEVVDGVLYSTYDISTPQPEYEVNNLGNVVGPQGSKGDQGDTGAQGNQGNAGAQGVQGSIGNQGSQGDTGNTGPQGTQGSAGTGLNSRGEWVSGSNYLEGDYVFSESSNTVGVNSMWIAETDITNSTIMPKNDTANWAEFQAPKGEQGVQGHQGNVGSQGDVGAQGFQGTQGVAGVQGSTGEQGVQGSTGVQGDIGYQGPTGNTGDKGDQGNQGVQGSVGSQGSQGNQGTTGSTGSQGVQGNQGYQGISGEAFAFEVRGDDLYVIYEDGTTPNFSINSEGYLIRTIT